MQYDVVPSEITGGLPVPKSPGTNDEVSASFVRYETKMSRQEIISYSVMQSNLNGVKAGVSRSHSSQMPGVMPRTR